MKILMPWKWNIIARLAWNRVKPDLYAWVRNRATRLPQSAKEKIADWLVDVVTRFWKQMFPMLPGPVPSSQLRKVVMDYLSEGNEELGDLLVSLLDTFKP